MREIMGQPWTYSEETKAKIEADKRMTKNIVFATPKYEPKQTNVLLPKKQRPLQQVNGRRVDRTKGKVAVDEQRKLPPIPKDYTKVAQAKRIKRGTVKLRPTPKGKP